METTTHMLGVPPKSSGGATNRCVMSRLTKCLAPSPFSARSARLTSAPHQHVDHDPATARSQCRILDDREARVSAVVTVLSRSRRRGDFGFDFANGRSGLPDDPKPPIIAGPNAVIDRRRLAIGDYFLSGALGVLARREA